MIISVEGLKGTGKSTVVKRLEEELCLPVLPKFTKGKEVYPGWLENLEKEKEYLTQRKIFGLQFYANFFVRLPENKRTLCNKGLITLGSSCVFSYFDPFPPRWFNVYEKDAQEIFSWAVNAYHPYLEETLFIVLHAAKEKIQKRIAQRKRNIPSERVFIGNYEDYKAVEEHRTKVLVNEGATIIHITNEKVSDLERLVKLVKGFMSKL